MSKEITFFDYFVEWIELYKVGAVKEVTLHKYYVATRWIKTIAPDIKLVELNRKHYQMILNEYAKTHEKQITLDFHHQLKSVIRDALEDQLISVDPTRKIVIKGKQACTKKEKYLSQFEL